MDEFDRDIFESLVEKVVVGSQDEEGNPKPYTINFVLKAGLKFDEEVLRNLKNSNLSELGFKPFSLQSDEALMPCSHTTNDTCRDYSSTIQKRLIIFARIALKTKLFMFKTDIANYRNKELKDEIVVRLGF